MAWQLLGEIRIDSIQEHVLRRATFFRDLVVGCVDYGEIHFIDLVDLTGLPKLGMLLGELVRFDNKECSVYPTGEDVISLHLALG